MHAIRCAAFALAALAAPAAGQDLANDTEAVRVFAAAPPSCVVSAAPTSSAALNAVFTPDGTGGGAIAISQRVDPQTAEPRASRIDLALPVVCNAAHRLLVTSDRGGLLRAGGQVANRLAPDSFGDPLPYTIGGEWGGQALEGSSDRAGAIETAQPARNGELRLSIATADGGGLLTAGNYSDTVTIQFEPAS
jgi:hypothetical protein